MSDIQLTLPLEPSIEGQRPIDAVYEEIRQVYLGYPYPWVIGYSGGKDSTSALQLVWRALAELPKEKRSKPVYVISSDTLVETPVIVDYIDETLRRINEAASAEGMPFKAQKLSPILADTFWVNLIGRGYPAPTSIFRWCTERLKIRASNRFILEKVAEHGQVILVLGSRRGESSTRDQVINMHRFRGLKLAQHGQLPGAWVYMPVEHFTTDDIWAYLLQNPSPWGSDNRQLAALYRSAQSGECPLVVDQSTASCGNSRFGCWVCTVVERDRSMEAMIESGEEWMIPLLEFRDWLSWTQDPNVKPMQREYKSRDGHIKTRSDGGVVYRTYTLSFSKEMLGRLLDTQMAVQEQKPGYELISEEELHEIRRIWLLERQDWEDSLPKIFLEKTGRTLTWNYDDISRPGEAEAAVLQEVCERQQIPVRLVQKLLDAEWQYYGMRRRGSIFAALGRTFREDWRSLEEVHAATASARKQTSGVQGNKE